MYDTIYLPVCFSRSRLFHRPPSDSSPAWFISLSNPRRDKPNACTTPTLEISVSRSAETSQYGRLSQAKPSQIGSELPSIQIIPAAKVPQANTKTHLPAKPRQKNHCFLQTPKITSGPGGGSVDARDTRRAKCSLICQQQPTTQPKAATDAR